LPLQLKRIESHAFQDVFLQIALPSTVMSVACDVVARPDQYLSVEGDSCREFGKWLRMRQSGMAVDFRRILRIGSGFLELRHYLIEGSVFEEGRLICEYAGIQSRMYRRFEDGSLFVVKSIHLSNGIDERVIENLINLRHPCIAAPIGFIFSSESRELKVVRLYSESASLAEVLSAKPAWWTATAKAKAVLGLRFTHSFGLIHGRLTADNVLFDSDHWIHITDFFCDLEAGELDGFSSEEWTAESDVRGFASLLFEIVVGRPPQGEVEIPTDLPWFLSDIIETGLWRGLAKFASFRDIFDSLRENDFKILAGVDSAEVSDFVRWIQFSEQSNE
jgi:hypothetical protein